MKKILSFALALITLLSLTVSPALADSTHTGCVINCDEYNIEVTGEGECTIIEYKGKDRVDEIPETIEGCTVTSIGAYAYSKNYYLYGVKIPSTVKTIGEGAFFYCYNMSTVTIPDTVESIGEKAFGYNRRKFDLDTCTYIYRADPTFTVYASNNSVGAKYAKENKFELNEDERFNDFCNYMTFNIPYQWKTFNKIYCHIWDLETGEPLTAWQTSKEECEVTYDKAYFDADTQIGINLSCDTVYALVFSTDTGEQTFPVIYTDPCFLYTLCTDDTYVRTPRDEVPKLLAKWWDGDGYADLSAYEDAFGLYDGAIFTTMDESSPDESTYDEALPWGDANCDGKVNVKDATAIQKHVAGLITLSDPGIILSNFINKTTPLTVRNATEIQKYCAGLRTFVIIGEPAKTRVPVELPHVWYRQDMYALSWSDPDNVTVLPYIEKSYFLVPIYNSNIAFTCNGETTESWTLDFYDKDRDGHSDYVCEAHNTDDGFFFLWTSWD